MAELELVHYDAMVAAIERVASVDEVKEIRAKAVALEAYAKEANNRENERKCCQIRIRAERRCGALLREGEKAKGARGTGSNQHRKVRSNGATTPTLADLGITKDQSSDWQRLASIPERKFQEELDRPGIPSTEDVLRSAYPPKPEPSLIAGVDPDAMRVWGKLCDFQREKLMQRDQKQLLGTMTDPMREDTLRLAPQVISWLSGFLEES